MKYCIALVFISSMLPLLGKDIGIDDFKAIPKSELHLHLGGAWPLEYLKTIATEEQYKQLCAMLDELEKGMEYEKAFGIFDITSKIVNTDQKTQDGVASLCKQLHEDGVIYVEIRTSLKNLGSGIDGYIESILKGIEFGCKNTNLSARLILSLRRDSTQNNVLQTIESIQKYKNQGIVGLDISGISTQGDGSAIFKYADLINKLCIPITLHLGESPYESPEQQIKELMLLNPVRIGHGVYLSGRALQWICNYRIPIELCLTSALKVNMIKKYHEHPALIMLKQGYPVVICTDDPLIFKTTLSKEWALVANTLNISVDELIQLQKNQKLFGFERTS